MMRLTMTTVTTDVRHRLQPQPRRLHPLRQLPPAFLLRRPRRLHLHFAVKQCQYKVLGLGGYCTADEICSAYRRLALQHHPDKLAQFGISPTAYRLPPACPLGLSKISLPIEDTRPPPSHLSDPEHQLLNY
ncbi:hypothetical protein RJ640_001085 [Escallonia rubra]|uniref:J domain-containing protein n=1 Tax=Escallonia rubra TaxID=112253 RepID=A0AA88UI69_9ASTE|nr:hypothetical protein RJ640_001085 [Escallonia rubra]